MSDRVTELIKQQEGLRHFVYKCSEGRYTIGYGRNVDVAGGKGVSIEEAEYLLANDLKAIQSHLVNALPVYLELNDARRAVITSMAYNLGVKGLLKFKKMISALARQDYETAADEMLDSRWAKQVKQRAADLAQMMSVGLYLTKYIK